MKKFFNKKSLENEKLNKTKTQFNWRKIIVIGLFIVFIFCFPSALEEPMFLEFIEMFPDNISILVLIILFYFWVISIAVCINLFFDYIYVAIHYRFNKKVESTNGSLYIWLGENEISDSYLISLFDGRNLATSESLNIGYTKEILAREFSDSKENYMLFKNYLEFRLKNNTHNIINGYIFSIILGALSTIFMPQLIKYFIEKFQGETSTFEYILTYLNGSNMLSSLIYIIFGVGVYITILGVINSLSTRKRRIKYLISILDVMIQNKE